MRKPAGVERLYIDFDSFFATAEQHLQPHLRGRPVGVIPIDTPNTGLIAASREAKRLGIKRGMWVRDSGVYGSSWTCTRHTETQGGFALSGYTRSPSFTTMHAHCWGEC
jgi:impB/mucB/samB family